VIVVTLTSSRLEISSNVTAFPFSDVSGSKIISARLINLALCTPVLRNFSYSWRCSVVNLISFFFNWHHHLRLMIPY
jgi:hypothetical protein